MEINSIEKLTYQAQGNTNLSYTPEFLEWLRQEEISLAISTYQTNKLFLVGRDTTKHLFVSERSFERAMGLHVESKDAFYLSTRFLLWRFENALAEGQIHKEADKVYIPRKATNTGDLDAHDISTDKDGNVVFVNTRYNCIAQLSEKYSFKPLWMPPFISKMISEDRCHLNGMGMRDGKPRYVTMVSQTDRLDAWREHRHDGGIVMDMTTSEVLVEGLSMPHSPRYYQDKLWVLNAGRGEFGYVENNQFIPIAQLNGFLRGLSFYKNYALIGLSKPRYERTFAGLPLDGLLKERNTDPHCGVWIVDINTGETMHELEFIGDVVELYDVSVLPNTKRAMAVDLQDDEITRYIAIEGDDNTVDFKALTTVEEPKKNLYSTEKVVTQQAMSKRPITHTNVDIASTSKEAIKYQATTNVSLQQILTYLDKLTFPKLDKLAQTRKVTEPLMMIVAHNGQYKIGSIVVEAMPDGVARILSWYVIPPYRGLGIGKELIQKAEKVVRKAKFKGIIMDYVTDWTHKDTIEGMIKQSKWETPIVKLTLCKASHESISTADWLQDIPALPSNMEIGLWKDVSIDEKKRIQQKKIDENWFPDIVSPFQNPHLINPKTSVVLRRDNEIIGWIITHSIKADTVEFTGSFVDFKALGLQRQNLLLCLISKAVNLFLKEGYKYGIWQIPQDHKTMFRFMDKYLKPHLITITEQKVAYKTL